MKDKGKYSWFLTKLGVKWLDCSVEEHLGSSNKSEAHTVNYRKQPPNPSDDSMVQDLKQAGEFILRVAHPSLLYDYILQI